MESALRPGMRIRFRTVVLVASAAFLTSCNDPKKDRVGVDPGSAVNEPLRIETSRRIDDAAQAVEAARDSAPETAHSAKVDRAGQPNESFGNRWQDALEFAQRTYKGRELHGFLYSYADDHASSRDFDRIGFLKKLQEIIGPGSHYSALVSLIYSKPLQVPPETVFKEIHELGLSPLENEVVLSAAVCGKAVTQASALELKELLNHYEDQTYRTAITAAAAAALGGELSGLPPGEVAAALSRETILSDVQRATVVERLVQKQPALWWEGFGKACGSGADLEVFEQYSGPIADGLMLYKEPEEILAKLSESSDTRFPGIISREVASRWVMIDSGAVAKWAAAADPGPVRDEVIRELVRSLRSKGLIEDAEAWSRHVNE